MSKIKAVYCEQYGYLFKLTPGDWHRMLREAIESGGGHTFMPSMELKRRPGTVIGKVMENGGEPGDNTPYFYVLPEHKDTVLLYQPLDWELENYQDALKELEEKDK